MDSFHQINVFAVEMYFPVHLDADDVSVRMNDVSVNWTLGDLNHSTVIGRFPTIYWTISPLPDSFNISVCCSHPVPKIDGNSTFVYTMGTGRYLDRSMPLLNVQLEKGKLLERVKR